MDQPGTDISPNIIMPLFALDEELTVVLEALLATCDELELTLALEEDEPAAEEDETGGLPELAWLLEDGPGTEAEAELELELLLASTSHLA